MADDSFTRSLYIGRDKAIEVARRREAVEKELKARREAKIREQKERISRATQQKEAELKEKSRQRQEKELQKQKNVLDRRCAQLEMEKAKKAEILQKAHISASRTNQTQKKSVYAFGSSTPRELSYLEKLSNNQKACNNNHLAAPNQAAHASMERLPRSGTPVRTFSRIVPMSLTQKKYPSSTAMARSVFGTLNYNNTEQPPPKIASLSERAAKTLVKVGAAKRTARVTKSGTPNLMIQSMYEQNKSSFTTKKASARPTPVKAPKNLPKAAAAALPSTPSETVKKPVIRPRKAAQAENTVDDKSTNGLQDNKEVENGGLVNESQTTTPSPPPVAAETVAQEVAKSEEVEKEEEITQQQIPSSQTEEQVEQIVKREVEEAINGVISSQRDITNTSLPHAPHGVVVDSHVPDEVVNQNEEEEGEEQLFRLDSPVQPAIAEPQTDPSKTVEVTPVIALREDQPSINIVKRQSSPTPLERPAKNGIEEALDIETSKGTYNREGAENFSPMTSQTSSPLSSAVKSSAVLEQAEQERENRRQRLNQILQRTRMDGTEGVKAPATANGIDASALAQDLLAQRRQKLQLQANSPAKPNGAELGACRTTTLVDELAGFGFFQHKKNGVQEHIPGQIICPPNKEPYLTSMENTNNNEEKDSETDDLSSGMSSPTSQGQPPEDPRINEHNSSSSNTPPTEPSIAIR